MCQHALTETLGFLPLGMLCQDTYHRSLYLCLCFMWPSSLCCILSCQAVCVLSDLLLNMSASGMNVFPGHSREWVVANSQQTLPCTDQRKCMTRVDTICSMHCATCSVTCTVSHFCKMHCSMHYNMQCSWHCASPCNLHCSLHCNLHCFLWTAKPCADCC